MYSVCTQRPRPGAAVRLAALAVERAAIRCRQNDRKRRCGRNAIHRAAARRWRPGPFPPPRRPGSARRGGAQRLDKHKPARRSCSPPAARTTPAARRRSSARCCDGGTRRNRAAGRMIRRGSSDEEVLMPAVPGRRSSAGHDELEAAARRAIAWRRNAGGSPLLGMPAVAPRRDPESASPPGPHARWRTTSAVRHSRSARCAAGGTRRDRRR